jgi:hypothetical protein
MVSWNYNRNGVRSRSRGGRFLLVCAGWAIVGGLVGFFLHRQASYPRSGAAPFAIKASGAEAKSLSLDNLITTECLAIETDLTPDRADFYARFFDEFYDFFSREYWPVQQKKRLRMLLFETSEKYKRSPWSSDSQYGCYLGLERNTIVVNLESGLGTATHEMVHHFMALAGINGYRDWIGEGIPMFFEKFMGYLDAEDKLHLSLGYFSNWRFPRARLDIDGFTLNKLLTTDNRCVCRSFILFLHRRGYLKQFVRALVAGRGKADPVRILREVCGGDLSAIETDWKSWVRSQPIDGNVGLVPWAFVVPHSEWTRWLKENENRLYWDKRLKLFAVRENSQDRGMIGL